jgi:transposase InsO family protein
LLKKEISPSTGKKYPVDLILKIVGLSSAAWYKKKSPVNKPAKRGPKPPVSDEIVLKHIRKIITEGSFHGEGYEKIHKRVRKYIKVGKNRVYKLLKENNLLTTVRDKPKKKTEHTGNIKTEKPNEMWGTDGKKFYTEDNGWCWFFGVIDHFNDEIISWHAAEKGDRFAAMEPVKMAVKKVYGNIDKHICTNTNLYLRSDHGSQYDSKDFQNEMKFLGMKLSPAYVRSPECNGIIERFNRTIQEQVFDLYSFKNIEDAKMAIAEFIEKYNNDWLIHRLGLMSPLEYKKMA